MNANPFTKLPSPNTGEEKSLEKWKNLSTDRRKDSPWLCWSQEQNKKRPPEFPRMCWVWASCRGAASSPCGADSGWGELSVRAAWDSALLCIFTGLWGLTETFPQPQFTSSVSVNQSETPEHQMNCKVTTQPGLTMLKSQLQRQRPPEGPNLGVQHSQVGTA